MPTEHELNSECEYIDYQLKKKQKESIEDTILKRKFKQECEKDA